MILRCLQKRIFLVLLVAFLALMPLASQSASDGISVIKINNAQKTEYAKDPETGNEQIVLTGTVSITVSRGNTNITITGSKISFDRVTNMLFAQGAVSLTQDSGSQGMQSVSADTLLFNVSTMEGVFDNGRVIQTQSDAINLPSDSSLIVYSDMFGRDSSSTIAFKDATLTFCDEEDPHWKVWASNIWLLPGGEFAFFNAVLFVGHVPILYLPAFYYPKDELVFNPTFGYDERKGYYFQTTTYLFGRKGLESSSSGTSSDSDVGQGLYNFMRSSTLKEQKREGLVLHNLEEDYKGSTADYLKFFGDYYTTLGGMVGIEGALKGSGAVSSVGGGLSIAFSRTVFYDSALSAYLPYSNSGVQYYDDSNFMGLELPFRYGARLNLSLAKPFTLNVSMPVYSDPYFNQDFGKRSEYMDWIGFLTNGFSRQEADSSSIVSSFTWSASGSYNFAVPEFFKPFVNTASINSFSSSLVFSTKTARLTSSDGWKTYTPRRTFFYPSQVTPLKVNARITGTVFEYPEREKVRAEDPYFKKHGGYFPLALEIPLDIDASRQNVLDGDASDAEKNVGGENSNGGNNASSGKNVSAKSETEILSASDLPELSVRTLDRNFTFEGLKYSLGYTLSPSFTSQLTYNTSDARFGSSGLVKPEDFDWSLFQSSYIQVKSPLVFTGTMSYMSSFFAMTNELSLNPVYQSHPSLDGYTSESSVSSIRATDYGASGLELSEENDISLKPFIFNPVFSNTSLTWKTSARLLHTEFLGDADNPQWTFKPVDFTDSESVTVHSLSASLSAVESDDFSQVLTLTTSLPPKSSKYNAVLGLTFPYTKMQLSVGVEEKSHGEWNVQPLSQSLTFKVMDTGLTLTESINYSLEDMRPESLKLSLAWKTLSLSYTMGYTFGYDADVTSGWEARAYREFLPETLSLDYSLSGKTYRWWKNRITFTPAVNTSLVYDCLRPTNSYFKFVPTVSFGINEFLTLKFSSESRNSVIYRYFQGASDSGIELPGETNVFVDLLNSFAFWGDDCLFDPEQAKRKSSGFKLKSLKLTVEHNLCDWDLSSTFSVSPRLINAGGRKQYSFDPYFTIAISWRPLNSLKAHVEDEYGEWSINP